MSLNRSALRVFDERESFLIVGAIGVLVHEVEGGEIKAFMEGAIIPDGAEELALVGVLDGDFEPAVMCLDNAEFGRALTAITAFQKQMGSGWQPWAAMHYGDKMFLRFVPSTPEDLVLLPDWLTQASELITSTRDKIEIVGPPAGE